MNENLKGILMASVWDFPVKTRLSVNYVISIKEHTSARFHIKSLLPYFYTTRDPTDRSGDNILHKPTNYRNN